MKKAILFGSQIKRQNTILGNASAYFPTTSSLATRLGISVTRISNFEIKGDDVYCTIFGSYTIANSFSGLTGGEVNMTSFIDLDGLAQMPVGFGNFGFYVMTKFKKAYFPKALSIEDGCFDKNSPGNNTSLELLYFPRVTAFGTSTGNNQIFRGRVMTGCKIYVPIALQTCNAGNPDGDLVDAVSKGANIIYIPNLDKPSTPTFTLTGGIYGTAIQINNIVCTGTNAIDYYEVWINGQDSGQTIKGSGDFATSLIVNTSYDIQLVARDIFLNESEISSKVTASTASSLVNVSSLVTNYYNLNSNINDSKGSINGTNYGGTFTTGKVGNALTLNGTSQYATLPDNDNFSFTDGANDVAFSICFYLKPLDNNRFMAIAKLDNQTTKAEWIVFKDGGNLNFHVYSNGSVSNFITIGMPFSVSIGQNYFIKVSYNGNGSQSGLSMSIDGVEATIRNTTGSFVKTSNTSALVYMGKEIAYNYYKYGGQIDCLAFLKGTALTQGHASDIKAIHDSGNDLI